MADIFGLAWNGQLAKLRKSKLFSKGMQRMCIPSPGGEQEAVLLERRLVHAWLLSIEVGRLTPERQEKLLRYQEECADVLHAYFTKGIAVNPRAQAVTDPWDMLIQMAESGKQHAQKIAALEVEQKVQMVLTIANQQQTIDALERAIRAEGKADMALDEAHRMTLEEFILKNGLVRQFPQNAWRAIAGWLGTFCEQYNLSAPKVSVVAKPWGEEKSYPLQTLSAWLRHEQTKPRQVVLVPHEETTPLGEAHVTPDSDVSYQVRKRRR